MVSWYVSWTDSHHIDWPVESTSQDVLEFPEALGISYTSPGGAGTMVADIRSNHEMIGVGVNGEGVAVGIIS
jgi:hypothetical protein